MNEYTPKTENVRLGYAYRPNLGDGYHHPGLLAEFDRWLAQHDAEVERRMMEKRRAADAAKKEARSRS